MTRCSIGPMLVDDPYNQWCYTHDEMVPGLEHRDYCRRKGEPTTKQTMLVLL